jgi:hypothetical protein
MPTDQQRRARHHAASAMTTTRYRKLIAKLGLSQRAAGRFLGVSDTHSARLAVGTATIPPPIAMLLELMVAHNVSITDALRLAKVNIKQAEKTAKAAHINKQPRFFEAPRVTDI